MIDQVKSSTYSSIVTFPVLGKKSAGWAKNQPEIRVFARAGEGKDGGDCTKIHPPSARKYFLNGFLKRVLEAFSNSIGEQDYKGQ